jgi:hypothetical protein
MEHQKKLTYVDELGGCGLLVISPSFKVLVKGNSRRRRRRREEEEIGVEAEAARRGISKREPR